jgi:hypothetical protein
MKLKSITLAFNR